MSIASWQPRQSAIYARKKGETHTDVDDQKPKVTQVKKWKTPQLKSSLKDLDAFLAQKQKTHRPVYRLAGLIQSCLRKKNDLNHEFLKNSLCDSKYSKPTEGLLTRPAIKTLWDDYQTLVNVTQCP